MGVYRVCKSFTVESGHMLSKHPERCRFPHGHTRHIEVVLSSPVLDQFDMVVDFKALKLMVKDYIERLDHAMAMNVQDPAYEDFCQRYSEAVIPFGVDPTTEVLAKDIFDFVQRQLEEGFEQTNEVGVVYKIPAGRITLERVRVGETPTSWAEYGR